MAKQVIKYDCKSCTIFEGFYNSRLFDWDMVSDMLQWDAHEQQRKIMAKFDLQSYENAVGKKICELLSNFVKDDEIFGEITFKQIKSPREYNFETDTLEAEIEVDLVELTRRITKCKEAYIGLNRYLRVNYSHRSGFVSWIPNNCPDFFRKIKPDTRESDVLLDYWFLYLIYADKYVEAWDVQSFLEDREECWYHDDLYEFCCNEIYEHCIEVEDEKEADIICEP